MKRDSYSTALLETDVSALHKYRKEKQTEKNIKLLHRDVSRLSGELDDLRKIVEKIESKIDG